jgi:hypothetical protein
MPQLTRESIVQWSSTPVSAEVGEEVVLMHLPRGRCYGLGPIGSDLWRKLKEPIQVGRLIHALSESYDAQPGVIEADVLETLEQYVAEGLIEVS